MICGFKKKISDIGFLNSDIGIMKLDKIKII